MVARQRDVEVPLTDEYWCISISEAPLAEKAAVDMSAVFTALSDPVRLRLLSLVAAQGEVCSCDLEAPLGRTQPTISHHTRVLAAAGLLASEKRGRWMFWKVPDERLAGIQALLSAAHACARDGMETVPKAARKTG
ncbi:metalloregulator ArsR/SmtB family transcription factor [Amycolatopsis sp. NPDC051071]|uniref:ArsR/SmtB family transcription factor n=1 Tax=Amycolatopsis sp. NPDC051071 TaxID=3154637 RepID=UPI0034295C20